MKTSYGFDEYGRFKSVQSAQSADTHLFTYSYLLGSHLLKGYTATQPVSSFEFQVSKTYEPNRDLITTVSNTFGTATISAFNYENDGFGRRTARVDTTPSLTVNNAFGYNLKSEVTSATMGENAYGYEYDPIGNRIYAAFNAETNTYSANALNQYAIITNSVPLCEIKPSYDFDGNMLTNGVFSYSWDAENRLTDVYSNDTLLVSNVYDHQSRRIAKIISRSGAEAQRRDFIYDGWNLISEKLLTSNFPLSTFYTWGLDLSGTLQGAGGVGGLLAVHTSPLPLGEGQGEGRTVFPFYDANGNVTEYVDAAGTIRAHYSFDAFGNTISQSGDMASAFSHRFSTKYWDAETSLYYYGYRYYAPQLGRWVNRDPSNENGGFNVYQFVDNNSTDWVDFLGLIKIDAVIERYKERVAAVKGKPCSNPYGGFLSFSLKANIPSGTTVIGTIEMMALNIENMEIYYWDCYSADEEGKWELDWDKYGFSSPPANGPGSYKKTTVPHGYRDPYHIAMSAVIIYEYCQSDCTMQVDLRVSNKLLWKWNKKLKKWEIDELSE